MTIDPREKKLNGLAAAVIVIGVLVVALLAVVVILDPVKVQPEPSPTAPLTVGTPAPTPTEDLELPSSPVVNVDGIAILGGLLVLIVLAAVYREILIYRREGKK